MRYRTARHDRDADLQPGTGVKTDMPRMASILFLTAFFGAAGATENPFAESYLCVSESLAALPTDEKPVTIRAWKTSEVFRPVYIFSNDEGEWTLRERGNDEPMFHGNCTEFFCEYPDRIDRFGGFFQRIDNGRFALLYVTEKSFVLIGGQCTIM
jgi:hypothetical protein